MGHVYASLAEFKNFLREQGEATLGTNNDATMLAGLESVSRRIDAWAARGPSGFGPRTATNKYDGNGGSVLRFDDDLASVTSVKLRSSTAAATQTTATVETDFYLLRADGSYGDPPYRKLRLHGAGAVTQFGRGYRVTEVAGTWGYPVITRDLLVTTIEALDASEQVIDVSALTGIALGMTLLVESEQVYVSGLTDAATDSITVDRGCNGTTAALHDTGKTLKRIIYDAAVVDACNRVMLRRWRSRDAGADGMDGGGQVGAIAPREGEDLILQRTIGHLRLPAVPPASPR